MLPKRIAFVDVETTGARATYDRIIEIGIVVVEENSVTDTYQTLINPECYVSPFIEELTGISKHELERAPIFDNVRHAIHELLGDSIFVAHNVRFDYAFLKNEFKRYNMRFTPKHFCTVKLSRLLFPRYKRHNLDSIIKRFDILCEARHRALGDAKVIWEFYQKIQKQFSEEDFTRAVKRALKQPSLPLHLPLKTIDKLPELPGVYMFYSDNTPLYIGKSINIRDRVLSHFSNDHASGIDMNLAQETRHVEFIQTAGELGALFLESTLVKKLQPLYNRKLRAKRELIVLKEKETTDGYKTVSIEILQNIAASELNAILGIFRSKKQAKDTLLSLSKEYSLCQKLLEIEPCLPAGRKTKHACFGYHLGWCKGACKQKEKAIKYNTRFQEAFSKHRLKSWPFRGAIIIEEQGEDSVEKFIIDKWCFLGSFKSESQDFNMSSDYVFDLDTYKILVNYIFNPKYTTNIKQATSVSSKNFVHF